MDAATMAGAGALRVESSPDGKRRRHVWRVPQGLVVAEVACLMRGPLGQGDIIDRALSNLGLPPELGPWTWSEQEGDPELSGPWVDAE